MEEKTKKNCGKPLKICKNTKNVCRQQDIKMKKKYVKEKKIKSNFADALKLKSNNNNEKNILKSENTLCINLK